MSAVPRRSPDLAGVKLPETKSMPKLVRSGILSRDLKKEKKKVLSPFPNAGPSKPTLQARTDPCKAAVSARG